MFEGLKARLEKLLAEHTPPGDPRARTAELHAALLETKVAVGVLRDALRQTEQALAAEQQLLADAERRGRLAAQIPDPETVQVAEQFAARHRERSAMLEKKRLAQQEEVALAERDLESAGGARPETDVEGELLRSQLQRQQMDKAVDAQLEHLKRKLGKDGT